MNRSYRKCVLAGLLLVLASPLAIHAKDNWTSVRSKNFFVVGNASEKEIRQVANRLEQFRRVFTLILPNIKFASPVPTTVVVFKSDNSYKPFKPNPNIAGYFQPGEDVNYITLTAERYSDENPFAVIFHEYTHLLINNTLGANVPAWFNEGLAEFYSTFDVTDNNRKIIIGDLVRNHVAYLRQNKLVPLRTLFAVDHNSPYYNEGNKMNIFYAESWLLVHFLMQGNEKKRLPQMNQFLNLLRSDASIEEAFQKAFQMTFEAFEKEFKAYVDSRTYMGTAITFGEKLDFDSEMKSALLTDAEAQAYLGDLLLHTHRLDDAETRLQQALTLTPNLPMAQASLGIVRARQGRFDEAKKALQEAVKGDSKNYLVHYYYAYALSREGMDTNDFISSYAPETAAMMRVELKKAIELDPTFPGSYSLLAFVDMVTGEQLDDAVNLLKRALVLSPGRQDVALSLAQIYLRQEKFDLARQTLEPLRNTKDRHVHMQAESLLNSIRNYEDQVARYKAETEGANRNGPRLRPPEENSTNAKEDAQPPMSPSDYLQQALRPVEAGEQRIQGLFIKLDCDNKGAAYFIVQAGDRLYKLRAAALEKVQLVAYTSDAGEQISCGPRKIQNNVILTFRPASEPKDVRAKIDGDAVAVELVPKDFQLKK